MAVFSKLNERLVMVFLCYQANENPMKLECKAYENGKGRELSISEDWNQFKMLYDLMELPTG